MFELGVLFAFGAMLCWGFGDFFIQRCARKIGNVESLAYIGLFGSIFLIPFVVKEFHLIFSLPNLLLLLFLGVLTFFVALTDFEALKEGKLSVIDVILEIELPVTIALGIIFFKETLSVFQLVFIALIFVSILFMVTKSLRHFRFERGFLIALIAALGMGLINFFTALSSKTISPLMAVWFPWVVFSVFSVSYILKRKGISKFLRNGLKQKKIVLPMMIFDTLAWVFFSFAVLNNEVSIITAITESYPAIALFFGVWFNKEKIKKHQYVAAVLAIVFSVVLAMNL